MLETNRGVMVAIKYTVKASMDKALGKSVTY
jgi:hypothetical protein